MGRAWQRSFNKIPPGIRAAIANLDDDQFVISAVRTIGPDEISAGHFAHLRIGVDDSGGIHVPDRFLPEDDVGPWASRNRTEGWTKKFKDLPMVTKSRSVETPNFGDWSKGSHSITFTQEVYQRREFAPPGWTFSMSVLERGDDSITVGFELDPIFDRGDFDEWELFFALNVFQESVGVTEVRESTRPLEAYRRTLTVDWEILPPGEVDEVIRQVEERLNPSDTERSVIVERLGVLTALQPRNFITGTSGFARYVGAQFDSDLVVFENIRYGNAAYVMFDDWQRLSRLSRLELLSSDENFQRIVHSTGWERRLREVVRGARRRRLRRR